MDKTLVLCCLYLGHLRPVLTWVMLWAWRSFLKKNKKRRKRSNLLPQVNHKRLKQRCRATRVDWNVWSKHYPDFKLKMVKSQIKIITWVCGLCSDSRAEGKTLNDVHSLYYLQSILPKVLLVVILYIAYRCLMPISLLSLLLFPLHSLL